MAKVSLNIIKNWFKTALKPTEEQFWSTWDSFWHKDDLIPASSIENLDNRFNEKADNDALQSHLTDGDAHGINQKLAGKVSTDQLNAEANVRTQGDAYLQGQIDDLFDTRGVVIGEISGDMVIVWTTDKVPGYERTYEQVFGNDIFKALVAGNDGSGLIVPYEANITYTLTNNRIETLNIQNIIYPGKLTFI